MRSKWWSMVCESALEKPLCADVKRLGARGYTVVHARGAGRSGERGAHWDEDRSIRMEVVTAQRPKAS